MKYLLDTHILLWWYLDPAKIKTEVSAILEDKGNEIYISDVVSWEIVIKTSIGKLRIPDGFFKESETDFEVLPIKRNHIYKVSELEPIHKDPFDRLLIAQSIVENIRIITRDRQILKYEIKAIEG